MYYLVDTNVFIHAINNDIFSVADLCKKNGTDITITETILNELEPGYYLAQEDETARNIYTAVYNLTYGTMGIQIIRKVALEDIPGAKEELKKIRTRFYGWICDSNYLKYLISQGKIKPDDIKKNSFRNKDMGECELIAVAKCSADTYEIVSNDKGRVFLHPDQNLFDDYAVGAGVTIISSEDWLKKLQYKKGKL